MQREWTKVDGDGERPEPRHELEARIRARVDEAEAALLEANEAEGIAFGEVDRLRGDVGLGEGDPKELLRAQRRLATAQERSAQAASALRRIERWASDERTARDQADDRRAQGVYAEVKAVERRLGTEAGRAIRRFLVAVDEIEEQVAAANEVYRHRDPLRRVRSPIGDLRHDLERRHELLQEARR